MNEQWRVRLTCTSLGASQAIGVCRALMITYDKVVADKSVAKDERAFVTTLLEPARARLGEAVEVLDEATFAQALDAGPARPSSATALVAYRTPWKTLHDGLKVAVRVEKETGEVGAAELVAAVFGAGSGIPFLKGAPHAVWTEASKAIDTLESESAVAVVARHHLTDQVDRVRAAHVTFGHALGATGSLAPAPSDRVRVREALDACTAALCDYVLRACAIEDPARPGSDRLLSRLLAALEHVPRVHERAPKAAAYDTDGSAKDGSAPDNDDAVAQPEAPRKTG